MRIVEIQGEVNEVLETLTDVTGGKVPAAIFAAVRDGLNRLGTPKIELCSPGQNVLNASPRSPQTADVKNA